MKAILTFAFIGVGCLLVATAGCMQQRSDRIVAQTDQLLENTEKLLQLIKSVKDPVSAQASVPQLPDAYGSVFPLLREIVLSAKAADRRGGITQEAQQSIQRQASKFQSICKQIEVEGKRIRQIRGLPEAFWEVMRIESVKSVLLVEDVLPTGLTPESLEYLRVMNQMFSNYGPQCVVVVEMSGSSAVPIDEVCRRIVSSVGENSQIAKISAPGLTAITIGPVKDFNALVAAIDFGEIVAEDPAQGLISVEFSTATRNPIADLNAQKHFANIPMERSQSLTSSAAESARSDLEMQGEVSERMSPEEVHTAVERFVRGPNDLPSDTDPDYYQKLADMMVDRRSWHIRDDVITVLLRIKPRDIKDKETRQQIARNFRELAQENNHPHEAGRAIRGLVLYGGKYSIPILVDQLRQERLSAPQELFDGLAAYPSAEGAEALVEKLGDIFNHQAAFGALRRIGPVAEDALINVAPSDNPDVSLAAVQLLGDVGTTKCVSLLSKAIRSSNPVVAQSARSSIKKIRERLKNAGAQ